MRNKERPDIARRRATDRFTIPMCHMIIQSAKTVSLKAASCSLLYVIAICNHLPTIPRQDKTWGGTLLLWRHGLGTLVVVHASKRHPVLSSASWNNILPTENITSVNLGWLHYIFVSREDDL